MWPLEVSSKFFLYWELTLRNRNGLEEDWGVHRRTGGTGGLRGTGELGAQEDWGVHRREEIMVFHRGLFSLLGMGAEV